MAPAPQPAGGRDLTGTGIPLAPRRSAEAAAAQLRRRRSRDRQLRLQGALAISAALGLLGLLLAVLLASGLPAFTQTMVRVDFPIRADLVDRDAPASGHYRRIVQLGEAALLPAGAPGTRALAAILTPNASFFVRDAVVADPHRIGSTLSLDIPASDPFDQLYKGLVDRTLPEGARRLTDAEIAAFDALVAEGRVSQPFNRGLFVRSDSRLPETAGLAGAIAGSLYVLLVCLAVSFPAGVATAVYLEEFAPNNRATALVETNIRNLSTAPSIIFGLLGLAIFIRFLDVPRSTPLVGGLVLSLLTLPAIIIATRAALKAVPRALRDAAYGVGASRHQVVLHHVLPQALPGILGGTIAGLARAMGETAPLLLVGMNAFIADPPDGIFDASTTLPTQIYLWASNPAPGFVARTSAAILVLLVVLIAMNGLAVFLRRRQAGAGGQTISWP